MRSRLGMVVVAAALLAACKDSNDYTVGITKPLLVVSVSPSNAADNVNLDASVVAVFSDPLDPETVTTATFSVTDPTGSPVAGTVAYNSSSSTAAFEPASDLVFTGVYTVRLSNEIARLEDGAVLAATVETTFKTLDPPPLRIVATAPAASADNVDILTNVAVIFSEAVGVESLTTDTFFVNEGTQSDAGTQIAGTISYLSSSFTAVFTPSAAELKYSQPYTVTVDASVQSTRATPEGGQLGNDAILPFKTYDPPPLVVVASAPTALGDNVAIGETGTPYVMTVTFSEPLNAGSIDNTVFTVEDAFANPLMGTVLYTAGETTATLTLNDLELPLEYSSVYTIRLAASVESFRATQEGGQVGSEVVIPFKTIDPPPLALIALSPNHLQDDVQITLAQYRAVFDRAVDSGSVNAAAFTVSPLSSCTLGVAGAPLPALSVEVDATFTNQVVLTLTSAGLPLAYTACYQIFLDETIQATDATPEGGQLGVDIFTQFKTADPPPLLVVATSPSGGASLIDVVSPVQVIFSRAVDDLSVMATTFFLELCATTGSGFTTCNSPAPVAASLDVPLPDKAVLTPDAALAFNRFYRATLTTGIRAADYTLEGGNLANTVELIFQTIPVPPLQVVSVDPPNGLPGVLLDKTIAVTFNAPVFESSLQDDRDGNGYPTFYLSTGGDPTAVGLDTIPNLANAAVVISLSADFKTAFLDPPMDLAFDKTYTVLVLGGAAGVTGQQGQILPADFSSTFHTRISTLVLSTNPTSDEGISPAEPRVDVDRQVIVTFTTCMDPATITTASFRVGFTDVFVRTVYIPGTIDFADTVGCANAAARNVAIFTPTLDEFNCFAELHPFLYNTTYTAELADTITTLDGTGAMLTGGYVWSFRTGTPPGISAVAAENTHVSVDLLASSPTEVPVNASYVVTFDRDMSAASVDVNNVFVNTGIVSDSGTKLAGTVSYDAATRTGTLTLDASLGYDATHTLTLAGGSGGLTDSLGNFLDGDVLATFRTSPATFVDAAPEVITNAPRNWSVVAAFDRALDPLTINDATFQLHNTSAVEQLSGLLAVGPDRKTVSFTPIPQLAASSNFEFRITTAILDARGNPLAGTVIKTFATAAGLDATDPTLFSTSPAGAGQRGNVQISATFTEHIIPDSARASIPVAVIDTVRVIDGAANLVAGRMSYTFDDVNFRAMAIFTPATFLDAGVTYTAVFDDEVADLARRPFGGTSFTFTVGDAAPAFGSSAPGGGAADVDGDTSIVVTFTDTAGDELRPSSVNDTTLQLLDGSMAVVSGVSYSVSGLVVTLTPPALTGGVTYTVNAVAGGVKDSAGTGLSAGATSTFTIDALQPRIGSSSVLANVVTLNVVDNSGADRVRASSVASSTVAAPSSGTIQVHRLDMAGGSPVEEVFGCLTVTGSAITWDPTSIQTLTTGALYRVTATPAVLDIGGLLLDQDGDAGNGNQPFTVEFTAD